MRRFINELKLKYRDNLVVRVVFFLPIKVKNWLEYRSFRRRVDVRKLNYFKMRHRDERCFIIGNGPSLLPSDLEKISNMVTFASNRIYELYDSVRWRPNYWICVDPYIIEDDAKIIASLPGVKFVSYSSKKQGIIDDEDLFYIFNKQEFYLNKYKTDRNVGFSKDPSAYLAAGETVTYTAIQLAIYMGFKEIYLLGCDHSYSVSVGKDGRVKRDDTIKDHFSKAKSEAYVIQNKVISQKAYERARQQGEEKEVCIYNATRGGCLEVFPRVNFDSLHFLDGVDDDNPK